MTRKRDCPRTEEDKEEYIVSHYSPFSGAHITCVCCLNMIIKELEARIVEAYHGREEGA